jgi:UDP-4-amino-4,6-dideoxy-N-acetyl-beta-L-altrosamine transaminase
VSLPALKRPHPAARPFLPYGRQVIEEDDVRAVCEVLRGDYLTTGPAVGRFETALAKTVNAKHAVVCANGTAALYLAARALGLGPGTRIVVPSLTFLATASAPYLNGAEIVFADVDPDSGLMRPQDLAEAIGRAGHGGRAARADAVFNVHLNGQCGALEEIAQVARASGLKIVDDACHALGTAYIAENGTGTLIGENAFCDLSVFSFHPVKAIAMGEGGAVTTNDPDIAAHLMRTRNHGMTRNADEFANTQDAFETEGRPNPWYYELVEPGFNWRANDIQCALGLSQLAKLDRFLGRRRALAAAYDELLAPYAPRLMPVTRQKTCLPAWHLYAVLIDFPSFGLKRAAFMRALAEEGIGSQVHYFPVHRQRYYTERYGVANLPGADRYYARALSLPFFASMNEDDVERVVLAMANILGL